MFRLISDSQRGKADARASGLASAVTSVYQSETALARADAEAVARDIGRFRGRALATRFSALAREAGFAQATLTAGARRLAEVGTRVRSVPVRRFSCSRELSKDEGDGVGADRFPVRARELSASGVAVTVRQGRQVLSSTIPGSVPAALPDTKNVTINGHAYRAVRQSFLVSTTRG